MVQWCCASSQLLKWFNHDPAGYDEFSRRYFTELEGSASAWSSPAVLVDSGDVVLSYSAKNNGHNNAEALPDYIESKLQE